MLSSDLLETAARVKKAHADFLRQAERDFRRRQQYRKEEGIQVVAFCGPGRHGKDTCGEIWSELTGARYDGSVSRAALPLVATAMGMSPAECWETRHRHRMFWKNFCDVLRLGDPTLLLRMQLATADIVCGIRAKAEFWSGWGEGLIDYVAWVHRRGFPDDPTYAFQEFDEWETIPQATASLRGKFLVRNDGSLESLRAQLRNRAIGLGLLQERSQ